MSRKPNERKKEKSCPLGQMFLSSKKEDSDRTITGKSLFYAWTDRFPVMLSKCYLFCKTDYDKKNPGSLA